MNLFLRRLTALGLGLLIVVYGVYKVVMIWAFRGWAMPAHTRESLIAFANGIPDWERVVLFLLFIALPIAHFVLWRRGRRTDRLIRVSPGLLIQESAITGFLRGAVGEIKEVKAIAARCRMLRDKGLMIDCHVKLESQTQLENIQSRLKSAISTVMAERLGIVPLAGISVTVKGYQPDRATVQMAAAGKPAQPPPAEPAPEPEPAAPPESEPAPIPAPTAEPPARSTIDFAPVDPDGEPQEGPTPAVGGFKSSAFDRILAEPPDTGDDEEREPTPPA